MKILSKLKDKYVNKKVEHFEDVLIDTCNTLLHKRGEGLYTLDKQGYFKNYKPETFHTICFNYAI
jgi:hypothetical protein